MRFLLSILLLFFGNQVFASHIIGGDMYYDYLGNNQYKFYITLYRDCNSSGAAYDDPLKLTIYKANGILFQNIDVPYPGCILLPVEFNNPCATPPNNICVQRAIYTQIVTLPPIPGGYTISYQRCCRGPNVTNLINPDNTGLTLTTHIPGSETGFEHNSSPRFTNYPPILLCNNDQLVFNHVATDPDGDELRYSLVTPFSGASSATPAPTQAPAPPYYPVNWAGNFNAQQPLGPGSSTTINQTTGILHVNPNLLGLFVVGVRVQEYRNGVLIGETIRDFLFRVFDCHITLQAILPTQEQLPTFVSYCQGLTVNFVNHSYGASTYAWNFGVANSTTDVSSAFEPAFTFPSPGTYNVQMIANPGSACTDTAYMSVTVNNPFSLSWTSQDSICIINNQFDFTGITSNTSATFQWTLDATASVQQSSNLSIPNVSFSTPGFHVVNLQGNDGDCITNYKDSVYVFDLPTSAFSVPPDVQCYGYDIPFQNTSLNAFNFQWDFGVSGSDSDVSTAISPTYHYTGPGQYTVNLIASSTSGCSDTSSTNVTIYQPLLMSFTHNDSLCITNASFNFDATVSGPSSTIYHWDFGSHASPATSTAIDVSGVHYDEPGVFPVYLIGNYDVCSDTVASTIFVFGEPEIDFTFVNKLHCAPSEVKFVNLSASDVPAQYLWVFGDGGTSNAVNPSHYYDEAGDYSISLMMITTTGCADTLFTMKQDLIHVYPKPKAGFMVNPQKVDICNSEVQFIDQSVDAVSYFYFFDHRNFVTNDANFTHNYVHDGSDYPMQVVENQFGCRDSTIREVFVEPFAFYIPNTFVPDDDGVNDVFNVVSSFEIKSSELSIFDKWGERIFFSDHINHGWDGTYLGKKCQDGTYTYTFKYIGCDSPYEWKLVEGFVNLLK